MVAFPPPLNDSEYATAAGFALAVRRILPEAKGRAELIRRAMVEIAEDSRRLQAFPDRISAGDFRELKGQLARLLEKVVENLDYTAGILEALASE